MANPIFEACKAVLKAMEDLSHDQVCETLQRVCFLSQGEVPRNGVKASSFTRTRSWFSRFSTKSKTSPPTGAPPTKKCAAIPSPFNAEWRATKEFRALKEMQKSSPSPSDENYAAVKSAAFAKRDSMRQAGIPSQGTPNIPPKESVPLKSSVPLVESTTVVGSTTPPPPCSSPEVALSKSSASSTLVPQSSLTTAPEAPLKASSALVLQPSKKDLTNAKTPLDASQSTLDTKALESTLKRPRTSTPPSESPVVTGTALVAPVEQQSLLEAPALPSLAEHPASPRMASEASTPKGNSPAPDDTWISVVQPPGILITTYELKTLLAPFGCVTVINRKMNVFSCRVEPWPKSPSRAPPSTPIVFSHDAYCANLPLWGQLHNEYSKWVNTKRSPSGKSPPKKKTALVH
jgi:hypothetical protein